MLSERGLHRMSERIGRVARLDDFLHYLAVNSSGSLSLFRYNVLAYRQRYGVSGRPGP